jgi:hypothetical protein
MTVTMPTALSTLTPSLCLSPPVVIGLLHLHALCPSNLFWSPYPFTMVNPQLEQAYEKYRYEALFGTWLLVTGATFMRIRRQPYSTRLKVEQYESIFKGTSLGAIVLGIGMSPGKRGMRRVA